MKKWFFVFLCLALSDVGNAFADDAAAVANARPSTASANVHVLDRSLTIAGLDRQRSVRIYLPPDYSTSRKRYPVLYMHDAQNLFDDATSFLGEWGVDETLDGLAKTQGFGLIVVGIDNGGEHRLHELTAWDNDKHGKAEGAQYMTFIVEAVKPYIDTHYRSKPDRANTAIIGSSLGGLISHYAIYQYPQIFGKAGIFSPAYWYAPQVFDYTAAHTLPADAKLYFYAGGREDEQMLPNLQRMTSLVRSKMQSEKNILVSTDPDAQHNETAWRHEFPRAVRWLYGLHE